MTAGRTEHSTTHADPRIQASVFPIRSDEAQVLYDIGWSSGHGWRDEWDWWRTDGTHKDAYTHEIRMLLVEHLTAIRTLRYRADQIVVRHFI